MPTRTRSFDGLEDSHALRGAPSSFMARCLRWTRSPNQFVPRSAGRPTCRVTSRRSILDNTRKYLLEQVDDAAVVQLYADGFESLPLDQKTLIWHLYQAALAGRDIHYDQ